MLILPQIAYVYSCECPLYLLIVHEKTGGSKMEIAEMLDELKQKALHDPKLRAELLATKKASQPFAAFCSKCRELGYEIYDMDLITAGEEAYAAMRRSTNGGGENSPMLEVEDDLYELFFVGL